MRGLVPDERIHAVRRFNRFYTRKIGVLKKGLLDSPLSLAEGRVLYELAQREHTTASELAQELGLDSGYLSRLLKGFQAKGLIARTASEGDGRQIVLTLTARGREMFATLDERSRDEIAALLAKLPASDQAGLVAALERVERLLEGRDRRGEPTYILRLHQPGDIGWVIHRHGLLYAEEYDFNPQFEALVAEIGAKFLRDFDPARERCWIAERGVERLGSIFLVRRSDEEAQLRLLLVEPAARGLGIGKALVDACIAFAREAGYAHVMLWTNAVLHAARHLYEAAGFVLVEEDWHEDFGAPQKGQTWVLQLRGDAR